MLGFLTSNYDVGIYATANKLIKIVIVFLTSYGTVAFPRIIGDLNAGNEIKAKTIFNQIFLFIIFISFPLISFFYGFSNSIILLLGGEDFKDSIVTFNIMIPLLLVIPLSNFFGLQILMAYKKEKFILFTTIFGALLNFTINLLLIPILKANGAAIATIITESFITLLQFYFVLIKLKINFPWLNFFKYFFLSVIIFPIFIVIGTLNLGNLLTLIYGVLILVPLYLTILVIIKDDFLFNLINGIKSFIKSTMNL
jgi:O-antigen/teichoic acid export membrane protein